MADAVRAAKWDHTSQVMALIANTNRDPQRKPEPFEAHEFNPFAERPPLPTLDELPPGG